MHVRRPGNPKKWRAHVLCEGKICDLALLTVRKRRQKPWVLASMRQRVQQTPAHGLHLFFSGTQAVTSLQ